MKRMPRRLGAVLLSILIILIPLFLINAWGTHLADGAYALLQDARAVAEGSGAMFGATGEAGGSRSSSMLFSLIVAAFIGIGVESASATAVLSALGWSATAFAFLALGKGINRTAGSLIAALLLSFNPIIITTSGMPTSWVIALTWWAIAFLLRRRFFLMLVSILALVLLLLPLPVGAPVLQTSFAGAYAWTLVLFVVGIGAEIAAGRLAATVEAPENSKQVLALVLVMVFMIVGGYQLSKLKQLFQTKPQARWELEENIAGWLERNTMADSIIGTSEKIGYFANRRTVPLETTITSPAVRVTQDYLAEQPLQYLISDDSLPWQLLANSRWFRLNYEALAEFENSYVADAPYTIWRYQPPAPDFGPAHVLNARVPNRLRILGYQINQEELGAANEAVIMLYLEAAANSIEPTTELSVRVRLLSALDGAASEGTLAEWDVVLPNSIRPENWQPGEQIREQIRISAPPDLEPGAYPLNISLTGPASDGEELPEFWPISLDNDIERLDRLQVGYLVVPAEIDLNAMQSREASFADKIKLLGFSSSDPRPGEGPHSGEGVELTLFWEASEPLEGDFVVFTHVIDSSGQLVASHDSVPDNGNYPTPSWIPGMTIADTHLIQLPADLPSGDYQVRVGLYDPESGERLPVVAGDGSVPPDNAFPLTRLSIP